VVMLLGQSRVFFSMSRNGLLPRMFSSVHPRFRTPWISTLTVGFFVAALAASLPINVLTEMVSIGTLLAFVIVSAGVWILRRRNPDLERPFKAPWVPFTPIMGILMSLGLMLTLTRPTWIRLVVWLILGMLIYFGYGRTHSRVQRGRGEVGVARYKRPLRAPEARHKALAEYVSRIVCHAVFLQQSDEFLLEGHFPMMRLLGPNVAYDDGTHEALTPKTPNPRCQPKARPIHREELVLIS